VQCTVGMATQPTVHVHWYAMHALLAAQCVNSDYTAEHRAFGLLLTWHT